MLVFVVGGAWNLWADEVRLHNGDRLTGKIQIVEGKLTVSGSLAGDVTVEMQDVQTFSTDAPVEIRLQDGTVVKQRVLAAEAGYITTERSGLLTAQKYALADVVGIDVPVVPVRWQGSASLGFSLTRGNPESENFAVSVNLLRRSEEELVYRRGGPKKLSVVVATWMGYKKAGPLLISTAHRGTADGKPLRVFFSNVFVKLMGSDTWVNAQ